MASGIKSAVLNDGHAICAVTGVDFDGIITCLHTKEKKNKFVYILHDDGQINPTRCPLCQALLKATNTLGAFQTEGTVFESYNVR